MKKFANIIGIVLSLILPALALLSFAGLYEIFIYNWLWCSLYGWDSYIFQLSIFNPFYPRTHAECLCS